MGWAYCHVPNGSIVDMSERIEAQLERFAPGFRDRVLARHVSRPADLELHDANYVGGDIAVGPHRPHPTGHPPGGVPPPLAHAGARGVYLCSSATPPGPGVHGMCGWHAANLALADRG